MKINKKVMSTVATLASVFQCNFGASLAQANPSALGAHVGVKAGVLDGILNAGPVVQLLLLVMVSLSVISWTIIFVKYRQFRLYRIANDSFSERFWKATSLEHVYERVSDYPHSNLARVFKSAFVELQKIAESSLSKSERASGEAAIRLSGLDNLERTLRKSIDSEVSATESKLNFLATTGSTAPFVGLLGTVVGIMGSFSNIAASGSASLAVVAPGISEALFSTAIGLFAALPAVAAYNYFIGHVRKIEMDLNSFGSDFLNIAKRNFFKDE
jgi:biopolymer transport protein TolQ